MALGADRAYHSHVRIYRDVSLEGSETEIGNAQQRLSVFDATDRWACDEEGLARRVGLDATVFRFLGEDAPRALVWLTWEATTADVSNIVPATAGSLSRDEYNRIAEAFVVEVLRPTLHTHGIRIELGATDETIDDLLNAEVAKALRTFSHTANKSTGAAHPNDSRRWIHFVVLAHRNDVALSPDVLHRWLLEDEEWDDKQAHELAIQYEQARDLLRQYDEERLGG